jgi:hypothetical protein
VGVLEEDLDGFIPLKTQSAGEFGLLINTRSVHEKHFPWRTLSTKLTCDLRKKVTFMFLEPSLWISKHN